MTKKQSEDTRLLLLPSELVDRLKEVSNRIGTSLSSYASDVLEEALRADKYGASLRQAVDAYRMNEIHRGAGALIILRASLKEVLNNADAEQKAELEKLWGEAGSWYGKYLLGKLGGEDPLHFLRQDLLAGWNLDEVEIRDGDEATIRFTGFMMSEDFTSLLLNYLHGVMESIGFKEVERDNLRGMATIRYIRLKIP